MALADYRLCDVCEGKAFYDANITDSRYNATWDDTEDADPVALAVLCSECAKTRAVAVLPEGMTADRIKVLEAENARMKAQLDLIEEVGTDEIETAIGLRQALAKQRVEGDQLREVLAAVDTKLAEVFERWHWSQGPDGDEAVQAVEAIRNLIPRSAVASDPAERPSASPIPQALEWDAATCITFAEGHDREQAAQMGEPSTWSLDADADETWRSERIAAVRAGLREVAKEASDVSDC